MTCNKLICVCNRMASPFAFPWARFFRFRDSGKDKDKLWILTSLSEWSLILVEVRESELSETGNAIFIMLEKRTFPETRNKNAWTDPFELTLPHGRQALILHSSEISNILSRTRLTNNMASFRFCAEWWVNEPHFLTFSNNMLYPREDKADQRLLYSCRNCDYTEIAENPKVYRNELMSNIGETAGVVEDIGSDPTLPRSDKQCPQCHTRDCVFFESQQRRRDASMILFYVCLACRHVFRQWESMKRRFGWRKSLPLFVWNWKITRLVRTVLLFCAFVYGL